MTEVSNEGRAGPLLRVRLALLLSLLAVALPAAASAQVPDTVPRDTVEVPIPPEAVVPDTVPGDSIPSATPDSLLPGANLLPFGADRPVGFAFGRWEISREELLRTRVLSLAGLLERLPGVTGVRAGGFGAPGGVSTFGFAGGRLRVFRDGYEIDPFGRGTVELQHIGLIDIESVRVERTPSELRVHIRSFRLPDPSPYSEVEIGAGNYDTKLLRAILSRAFGSRGVLVGSYDLATTDGATRGFREPFQYGGGRLAFSYALRPRTTLQAEFATSGVERAGERFPLDASRQELVVRGRSELRPGLSVDLALGRSSWNPNDSIQGTTGTGAAPDTVRPRLESLQGVVRAAYLHALGSAEGGARLRQGDERGFRTPDSEIFGRGVLRPLPFLTLDGEARIARYDEGSGTETTVTAAVGPFLGLTGFASAGTGERWLGISRDTVLELPDTLEGGTVGTRRELRTVYEAVPSEASGMRVGVEWRSGTAQVGAAFVALDPTTLVPFALGFDDALVPLTGEAVEGVELAGSLPVPYGRGAVRLAGSYSRWLGDVTRPYLPRQHGQASLEFHRTFYEGELEPTLRLEAEYRGPATLPGVSAPTEPYTLANLYLQIRIQDVRAFLLWENLLNARQAFDLPGFQQPGPRLVYGGRWFFRN